MFPNYVWGLFKQDSLFRAVTDRGEESLWGSGYARTWARPGCIDPGPGDGAGRSAPRLSDGLQRRAWVRVGETIGARGESAPGTNALVEEEADGRVGRLPVANGSTALSVRRDQGSAGSGAHGSWTRADAVRVPQCALATASIAPTRLGKPGRSGYSSGFDHGPVGAARWAGAEGANPPSKRAGNRTAAPRADSGERPRNGPPKGQKPMVSNYRVLNRGTAPALLSNAGAALFSSPGAWLRPRREQRARPATSALLRFTRPLYTRRTWVFGKARGVYRAREQGAAASHSPL